MYKLISFALLALFISACGSSISDLKKTKVSGYEYKHFVSNNGDKPNVGEFAYFQMDIYDDKDSLLQTYRNQKILPSVKILDQTDIMRKKNPIVDVLSDISVGDSIALLVPIDSVPNLPPGYDIEHIEYHLTLAEILTQNEHEARMNEERQKAEAQMADLRVRLPEVEALTEKTLAEYKAGSLELEETSGGVKYIIHDRGTGDLPADERMVTMQYYGRTVSDGNMFDNSFQRGKGYSFRVGRDAVIQGWHDAARYLPVGTTASIFIPPALGYGDIGSPPDIPAGAELYFYLEVEELFY